MSTTLDKARVLVDLEHWAEARTAVGALLAEDPDDPRTWGLLALVEGGEGDHAGMLAAAERLVALSPDHEWGHRLASVACSALGRHPVAVRAAEEAVRLAPHLFRTHLQLGAALVAAGSDPGRAHGAAGRAAELAPEDPGPRYLLGLTATALGRTDEARRHYQDVLALDPTHAPALNNLTTLTHPRSLRRQARGYSGALSQDPQLTTAQGNLEVLAVRFARRLWLAGVVLMLVCVVAGATGGHGLEVRFSPVRAGVGVAGFALMAAVTWWLVRGLPPGVLPYLRTRLRHNTRLLWTSVLTGVALLCAALAAFVPVGPVVALVLLRPLGIANLVLLARSRRPSR